MAKHMVKCPICKQQFDANAEPFVKEKNRYLHKACAENRDASRSEEDKDKEALFEYINKLYGTEFVNPLMQRQIKQYISEYNYTYSGMHKALVYFYEVKGNSVEKSNGSLGIIPHIYQKAYRYYYALWEAKQRNVDKNIVDYVPTERVIKIPIPAARNKKRNLFSFLDKELED